MEGVIEDSMSKHINVTVAKNRMEWDASPYCLPPIVIHDIFAVISLACIRLATTRIISITIPKHAEPWHKKIRTKKQ